MATIRTGSTIADAHSVVRVGDALDGKLANVDQPLYTVRDARERPVRHHARHGRVDGLTGLKLVDVLLPGIAPKRLIDGEMRWRSRSTPTTMTFITSPSRCSEVGSRR